jgi:NADH-quinone oxidoreductase subunit G
MYYNKEGFFRVKPVFNEKVNGHWMCDEGRDVYKYINKEFRNLSAQKKSGGAWVDVDATIASKELSGKLKGDSVAVVLTGQYTNEEYEAFLTLVTKTIGTKNVFHYFNNKEKSEDFDGILLRGDRNPNTKGLLAALAKFGIKTSWSDFEKGSFKTVIFAGPENKNYFPDLNEKIKLAAKASQVIWLQSTKCEELNVLPEGSVIIPMKSYVEKSGTFVNHAGIEQSFKKVTAVVPGALSLDQFSALVTGQELQLQPTKDLFVEAHRPQEKVMLEHRKKNEFVFKRGSL